MVAQLEEWTPPAGPDVAADEIAAVGCLYDTG